MHQLLTFVAVCLSVIYSTSLIAQFGTPNLEDGIINAADYDGHEYIGDGTTYRIAWNNDFLFIAAANNVNFWNDALNIYIDVDNEIPINSGNGRDVGTTFDNAQPKLPYNADYFGFFKKNYHSRKIVSGQNWVDVADPNDNSPTYLKESSADNWIEIGIPWNDITNNAGRPVSFNFLMFITNTDNKIHSIPYQNPSDSGPNQNDFFYFRVQNTNETEIFYPFGKICFTQHAAIDYGYNNTLPTNLYDLTVSQGSDEFGEADLFIDDNLNVSNDLIIGNEFSRLFPGGNKTVSITMSGTAGNFYNYGYLDCNPSTANVLNEKLTFIFDGNTVLRGNGGLGKDRTRFSNIIVNSGAALSADVAGVLDAEMQWATITNNGTFNMVSGETGIVNWSTRGFAGNVVELDLSNGIETIFNRLIIGESSTLRPVEGSTLIVDIREDLEIYGNFQSINNTGKLNLRFSGGSDDQFIRSISGQTQSPVGFNELTIASQGNVIFYQGGVIPVDFEIIEKLTLSSGVLKTLGEDSGSQPARHKLTVLSGAVIDASSATSGYLPEIDPCFIEGPISIEIIENNSYHFPLGRNQDYRPMIINLVIDLDGIASVIFTAEHFNESASELLMSLPGDILNISEIRYWTVSFNEFIIINESQIILNYGDLNDNDGVTSENDLRMMCGEMEDFGDWEVISTEGGFENIINSDTPNSLIYGANKTHFLTLGNVQSGVNPLPVSWLAFEGKAEAMTNKLFWSTASEVNNDYFEVERSSNGTHFQSIGRVTGNGTSNQIQNYSFTDFNPLAGIAYYRLHQFDFDGQSEFSPVIAISRKGAVEVYPNPFGDALQIRLSSVDQDAQVRFVLRDATGRLVLHEDISSNGGTVNTGHLPAGAYVGELRQGIEAPMVFKLIK